MPQTEPTRHRGRCNLLLIGTKPHTLRDLRPLLARHFPLASHTELPPNPVPADLARALASQMPKFCFVEISSADDPAITAIAELLCYDPKLGIAVILPKKDADLIVRCLRLGAADILISPFAPDQFDTTVVKLLRTLPQPLTSSSSGKVYSVLPVKGACGATTIASALVFQWKRMGTKRVLLADLDPITGVISFLLKVHAHHSFTDVLQRAADIDEDLWKGMVVDRDGVDVLVAPESTMSGGFEPTDASPILDYARYKYDMVVADGGSPYGLWSLSQALLSDEVLLVTTNELTALQSAQKVLHYLELNGVGRWKIRLIVNRYDPLVGLSEDKISRALDIDVSHVLPSDYPTVQKALLEGKPVPSTSRFGKAMTALAAGLTGRQEPREPVPALSKLRSLFTRI